ncbi:PucR family transcriptional regulator ligand-binding domain-containing protein [Brevibacterium sp. 50QC2O2]|jgi:purine catabolism regulator|uniref:PucR family transcriptional regulator n=1 Tax=Brevibacterium TaxID=1696 RepID=UPI00211D006D|nr:MULTISPECIES: PucR family transcriptional regulator [unclassified Brevibacterium]MCQ9386184.1 PucR family transcriptional regulator ligand-binding domain-containing protein [Brevibacterium sp. 68QC2CO]MCQ9388555.1 PucR family transcriptional regulator ligand-binding domain-containing protein [Brevibacterium sp. 50QC2O2]
MSNDAKKRPDLQQEMLLELEGVETVALTVREVLQLPSMRGCTVVAGRAGLDRLVEKTNVMEVPDILPWVKPRELLLTTGYPLREAPDALVELLGRVEAAGVSALCIKPGRYIDRIPPQALAEAERLSLPILELGEGVGFDEIMHEVLSSSLSRGVAMIRLAEHTMRELVNVVVGGGDLTDVCRMLIERIGFAAAVTTLDGRLKAMVAESDAERERLLGLSCFDESGRFIVEDEPARAARSQGQVFWGNCQILDDERTLGRIVAFSDRTPGDVEFRVLEQAAAAAALVLAREQSVAAVESKYRSDFVLEVLRGHIASPERTVSHAKSLGWDLDRELNVVVAEADPSDDSVAADDLSQLQTLFARAWSSVVSADDPHAAVVGSGDQVILLLAAADRDEIVERVRAYATAVRGRGGGGRREFSVGISRPTADVVDLADAYQQATRALDVGRQLGAGHNFSHFDGLGVYRLLLHVGQKEELRAFAQETLGVLAGDDKPEYADLRETLQALLDHNLNVAETARALFFHYNTLRYRITKLERMIGPFTRDPHLRLAVELALQIVKLP